MKQIERERVSGSTSSKTFKFKSNVQSSLENIHFVFKKFYFRY